MSTTTESGQRWGKGKEATSSEIEWTLDRILSSDKVTRAGVAAEAVAEGFDAGSIRKLLTALGMVDKGADRLRRAALRAASGGPIVTRKEAQQELNLDDAAEYDESPHVAT